MDALKMLPPAVLRDAADRLRDQAQALDAMASQAEAAQAARLRDIAYRRALDLATAQAIELADAGAPMAEAAHAAVARYHNLAPQLSAEQISFCAGHAVQREAHRRRRLDQFNRDRAILTYWRAGLTDAQIGARLGLHAKTVARTRRAAMADIKTLNGLIESVTRLRRRGFEHELQLWEQLG